MVTVLVNGDGLNEADETLSVNLAAPVNATLATASAVGTITNDDPLPLVVVGDARVLEGNAGTTPLVFQVSLVDANGLPAPSGRTVSVGYATADGTGPNPATTADGDYAAASGTVVFTPGQATQTNLGQRERGHDGGGQRAIRRRARRPANAVLGAESVGSGTITNDDGAPIFINVADAMVVEGNVGAAQLQFTVSLSKPVPVGQTLSVDYATSDGTGLAPATAGTDYVAAKGTLTFNAGESSQNVVVTVDGDTLDENDETLLLDLSNPTDGALQNSEATGTITDDDASPSLAILSPSTAEGNAGTKPMTFTVTLSTASGRTVTVSYATADGRGDGPERG